MAQFIQHHVHKMSCSKDAVHYKKEQNYIQRSWGAINEWHSMEQLFTTENHKIIFKLCLGEIIDFSS